MPRNTRRPRLSVRLASTVAALATSWSATSFGQQPGLASPPPVTAVGRQDVIQAALRPSAGVFPRTANAGTRTTSPGAAATVQTGPGPANTFVAAPPGEQFHAQLDLAIDVSSRRFLTANVHSPWQIFHGLLALKHDFQLTLGNNKVNAIQWIATGEPRFDNQPLLLKTPHGGKFHPFTRPYAFEGHPAQFLALLSQSDLPVGYAFKVGPDQITIGDIINNTKKEVNSREEVTWVLWALQHYLQPDAQWLNRFNEPWSIERLVQIETAAPVNGAPCGGNHRLFALTRTRDKHLKHGGQLVGTWAQADHKIRQHIEIARSLQNSDGSFSAKFYEAPGFSTDLNTRFNTTGHTMEFLSIALPNERLHEPWVRSAVFTLCNDLVANRQRNIDCGPLYHTLNALIIYRDRIRSTIPAAVVTSVPQTVPPVVPGAKPEATPSSVPNAVPVVVSKPSNSKPVEAKPVSTEKTVPAVDSKPPMPTATGTPTPPAKPQPSVEALNELMLDGEVRDKLNALSALRSPPAAVAPNAEARPLDSTGQPVLQQTDAPVSALAPENRPASTP